MSVSSCRGASEWRFRVIPILSLALCAAWLLPATGAQAESQVAVAGGAFRPTDASSPGNAGPLVELRFGGMLSENARAELEIDYRGFEAQLFNVPDVEVTSIGLHTLLSYLFLPDAVVTPYLGLGFGIGINLLDDDDIERNLLANTVDAFSARASGTTVSFSAFGILGLEMPVSDALSVFTEFRSGGDWLFSGGQKLTFNDGSTREADYRVQNIGGSSVSAGVRFGF